MHFTSETSGGAGVAARRLHRGLLDLGADSRFLYGNGDCNADQAVRKPTTTNYLLRIKEDLSWGRCHRLAGPGGGLFTSPHGARRTPLSFFGDTPDVVNLHWVARWLDVPSFLRSLPRWLPVVWSLHDMNPFTGGCHLSNGCERFTERCHHCPQLRYPWALDASWRYFHAKRRAYRGRRLHIVGNSRWTTAQARRSALLRDAVSFDTVPLGLDTSEYAALEKGLARRALGLPDADFVLGFACADLSYANKNLHGLGEAIAALPERHRCLLLTFGPGKAPPLRESVRTIQFGPLSSPRLQSIFYSALDVFVMPSKMETFGQAGLEAMACGTPVIAYRTGGIPDFVEDGATGLLAPDPEDPMGLTERLEWMRTHAPERRLMGVAGRQRVEAEFTLKRMAERYLRIYGSALQSASDSNGSGRGAGSRGAVTLPQAKDHP
jgi:glycosyltransferase involved in cell wall biosynthesis